MSNLSYWAERYKQTAFEEGWTIKLVPKPKEEPTTINPDTIKKSKIWQLLTTRKIEEL